MGLSFLDSLSLERLQRTRAIADEVCEYLTKVAEIARQRRANTLFLPQNEQRDEPILERPDCLSWADRVKRFGLPCPGALLDQPKWFIEDMEAVEYGQEAYKARLSEETQEEFSTADIEALALAAARNAPNLV